MKEANCSGEPGRVFFHLNGKITGPFLSCGEAEAAFAKENLPALWTLLRAAVPLVEELQRHTTGLLRHEANKWLYRWDGRKTSLIPEPDTREQHAPDKCALLVEPADIGEELTRDETTDTF